MAIAREGVVSVGPDEGALPAQAEAEAGARQAKKMRPDWFARSAALACAV